MRQLRFAPRFQAANAFAFFFVLFASASHSYAVITLESVDESRVSAVAGIANSSDNPTNDDDDTTTTPTPIIYGGVAGSARGGCAEGARSNTSTCDNCVLATGTETGDDRLLACNNRRVHANLRVRLFVRSDSIASGVPMMTFVNSAGTEVKKFYNPTGVTVTKGTSAEILVDWKDLCEFMTLGNATTTGGVANCGLGATADSASITVRIGIDTIANGTRNQTLDTNDEYIQVQFILRNGVRTASNSEVSIFTPTEGDVSISYFEIGSGDKKAYIGDNLRATDGFPTGTNINVRWVRALYKERATPSTPAWDQIAPDSPHQDLEVRGDSTTSIDLSPRRVTGLENDKVYDFKLAMVDSARNVGYYTSSNDDQSCEGGGAADSPAGGRGSGVPECHTARPSEVVGVLAKDMNCFVATASYGSPMASEVVTFRAFRDRFLKTNAAGRAFVSAYYEYGPVAAKFIAQNETLRAAGRATLWAPLQFVKFSLAHGFVAAFALLSSLIIAPPALWAGVRRIRKPRGS